MYISKNATTLFRDLVGDAVGDADGAADGDIVYCLRGQGQGRRGAIRIKHAVTICAHRKNTM